MEKVLILGGCGYIGSSLFKYLSNNNYTVDTVDLEWFGNNINPKNIKNDYDDLEKSFLGKYQTIILLAGHSSVRMCESKRWDSFENNVIKFVNLLEKLGDQKFIYASSSSVYGDTKSQTVDETYERYVPRNYYDLTKKTIDYYAHLSSLKYFGLRFGTVNGGSPNLRTELMINKMYQDAKNQGKIFIQNRHVHRPILGINDLCRAITEIIINKDINSGIYNLASFNLTVQEISKEVVKNMGNITSEDRGSSPTYDFLISSDKFKRDFNFHFEDSVVSIIDSLSKTYNESLKSERAA